MDLTPKNLDEFLRDRMNANKNSKWGKSYRELVERVKRESPDFSDGIIREIWYTRGNGVASLNQGGMSKEEFDNAQHELRELTKTISSGCNQDVLGKAYQQIRSLVKSHVLRKHYWALCHRAFAAFYPDKLSSVINESAFSKVYFFLNNRFDLGLSKDNGNWLERNIWLKTVLNNALDNNADDVELNMSLWYLYEDIEANNNSIRDTSAEIIDEEIATEYENGRDYSIPKNQILYGPPGTGKTYKTIELAVQACEPEKYTKLTGFKGKQFREPLKKLYDELIDQKRIRFVTFHQSFGYEEFIEGLRAETNNGNVSYEIKPGIFRQICDDALLGQGDSGNRPELESAIEKFKKKCTEDDGVDLKTATGKGFRVRYTNNTTFRVYPDANEKLEYGYPASIKHIISLYYHNEAGIYNLPYVKGILSYLIRTYNIAPAVKSIPDGKKQNYVLIIDEINRGNIAKIFGELITLIESSKRLGEREALTVNLPYSSDTFGVPNNLYLIGTMNTADRSLTTLDTALRRRFEFTPLLPDSEALGNTDIMGVNLSRLLGTLNRRIRVLYDSEHTLGHAYFIPVIQLKETQEEAFKILQRVMKNKVLPLLEEYFYNDWDKIRLVLGDNQKKDDSLRFVRQVSEQQNLIELFGQDVPDELDEAGMSFQLCSDDDAVWNNPLAYQQIYDPEALNNENN
ncbi:McrB family protein [Morganella morganii]|uniref:McrB family protein n=1 Tax=Morganella morganii TaxID=582 RepID=UPI00339CE4EF